MGDTFQPSRLDRCKIDDSWPRITYSFSLNDEEQEHIRDFQTSKETLEKNIPLKPLLISEFSFTKSVAQDSTDLSLKTIKTPVSFELSLPSDLAAFVLQDVKQEKDGASESKNTTFLFAADIPQGESEKYVPLDLSALRRTLAPKISEYLSAQIPLVRFWTYEDRYLLKPEMSYDDFIKGDSPRANSTVLYYIFALSKRLGIKNEKDFVKRVAEWKFDSSLRRREEQIFTEDLNAYIREIWNESVQSLALELEETKRTIYIHGATLDLGG